MVVGWRWLTQLVATTKPTKRDQATTGTAPQVPPSWVKVCGLVIGALILLFAILLLTGGPHSHGPGMHGGGGVSREGGHTEAGGADCGQLP